MPNNRLSTCATAVSVPVAASGAPASLAVAIGRKNWLFAGSDEGARRLAILYTLIGSAEQAGLRDPWLYLCDILRKLSQGWLHSKLDDLLPLSWQATHAR